MNEKTSNKAVFTISEETASLLSLYKAANDLQNAIWEHFEKYAPQIGGGDREDIVNDFTKPYTDCTGKLEDLLLNAISTHIGWSIEFAKENNGLSI